MKKTRAYVQHFLLFTSPLGPLPILFFGYLCKCRIGMPVLQMGKLRPSKEKSPAQGPWRQRLVKDVPAHLSKCRVQVMEIRWL